LGLKKPLGTEVVDITVLNDNADAIDAGVAKKADFDTHTADTVRHVTQSDKDAWNAKETPAGSQAKVDTHANKTNNPHSVTAAQIGSPVLGSSNQTVNKFTALNQRVDTRSTTETYDVNGNLTQIVEKDGATTVKTTTLTYTSGNLTQVEEVVGGNTITTTLIYDGNNNLTGTTRTVN
jgi:hypothetical protein